MLAMWSISKCSRNNVACKMKHGKIYASSNPPFNEDAVKIQDTAVRIIWPVMIQTEQTSAEGLRAVLFPEAEQRISGNVTGLLWPGNEGCRGNFCGHNLQTFFRSLRAERNLFSPVVIGKNKFPVLDPEILFIYCLGICLRKERLT